MKKARKDHAHEAVERTKDAALSRKKDTFQAGELGDSRH